MKRKRYDPREVRFDDLFNSTGYFERTAGSADRSPLIYYGGKSRDADWIISHFPPHQLFVDVFGGGAAVSFSYPGTAPIIYNDIGNVSLFYSVLRDDPEKLYRALYFTPYGRAEYEHCRDNWHKELEKGNLIEWARQWFVVINAGYTHEEEGESWHVTKSVNAARAFANHVDDLPRIVGKIRRQFHIERLDFSYLIQLYDSSNVLFYADPPYLEETRSSQGNYKHEMPRERHVELLSMLNNVQGQVVVSGYDSELYNEMLCGWRKDTITHKSSIQNSSSMDNRGDRTEVVWIKEHYRGLWQEVSDSSSDVPGISIRGRET